MPADAAASPRKLGTVILRACDLRQHALRFDGENLHLTVAMVSLAAPEHLVARAASQRIGIESGLFLRFHMRGRSSGKVSAQD
ncbi:hypothetical protein [Bradyrhizobium sp. AZCC 2262]|uniref:hypothetical protein n=1 Tax=Bradyrhizobium sp. AZCC 2262 TaxID=3117022 RepID=UPI002FEF4E94